MKCFIDYKKKKIVSEHVFLIDLSHSNGCTQIVGGAKLGAAFGPFLGGYLMNKIGRKWALFVITVIRKYPAILVCPLPSDRPSNSTCLCYVAISTAYVAKLMLLIHCD